ncbi:hypothetical protein FRC04_003710 [Tulasnella sp. 424]|nr:hypothetical protein FRC04_003710 [Tulasnella sp. 424]
MDASPSDSISGRIGGLDLRAAGPAEPKTEESPLEALITILRGIWHLHAIEKQYASIKDSQKNLASNNLTEEANGLEAKKRKISSDLARKEYPYFGRKLKEAAEVALKTDTAKDMLAKALSQQVQEQKGINEKLQQEVDSLKAQVASLQATVETLSEDSRLQHQAFGAIIKKLNKLTEKDDEMQA